MQLVEPANFLLDFRGVDKKHPKNYIREIRNLRGITLDQLAEMVGVTNPHISMLEHGKRGLKWPMIKKLAAALNVHPLDITDGPTNPPTAENCSEKELLEIFRGLDDSAKAMYLHTLKSFADAKIDIEPERPIKIKSKLSS